MDSKINETIVYEMSIDENFNYLSSIDSALDSADLELQTINETIASLENLKAECDKLDYALAACSGALCGIIDIFLVGEPGESPIGNITDKWFENRTKDFAKLTGWKNGDSNDINSAIRYLEKKFKIPYDQTSTGEAAMSVFSLSTFDHHFKSLGHNPSILGLFFSILDQFINTSHFVSDGDLFSLQQADGEFELHANSIPGKLICGFVNWFGHLISDISGSSGSSGRGMGIPSPLWTWINDVVAIKRKLNIPSNEFDKSFSDLAVNIYKEGYDFRFQTAQIIPVIINEFVVRLIYASRRLVKYFVSLKTREFSFNQMWIECEPFKNATVKRMLTVAHGTFCFIDIGEAVAQGFAKGGGYFNIIEFSMRLNLPGVGRFTISLYGEANRAYTYKREKEYYLGEKTIVENYISGLSLLAKMYDDYELLTFVDDFQKSDLYKQAFDKTRRLAELRDVPKERILNNKNDIDKYFLTGVNNNGQKEIKAKDCTRTN